VSSNGTFINGLLVGKGKTILMPDGGVVTLIVPCLESKNFNKNTPAYKLVAATPSELLPSLLLFFLPLFLSSLLSSPFIFPPLISSLLGEDVSNVSEGQLDEMMKNANSLSGKIDKWVKGVDDYRETGNSLSLKGTHLLDFFGQDETANETTKKLVTTLKKIEDLKSELHKKTNTVLSQPIASFRDNDVSVVIEMDKTTKAAKKKHDELKGKVELPLLIPVLTLVLLFSSSSPSFLLP
jgi:hypothetical protein